MEVRDFCSPRLLVFLRLVIYGASLVLEVSVGVEVVDLELASGVSRVGTGLHFFFFGWIYALELVLGLELVVW